MNKFSKFIIWLTASSFLTLIFYILLYLKNKILKQEEFKWLDIIGCIAFFWIYVFFRSKVSFFININFF